MPYKDPVKAALVAKERRKMYRERKRAEKYGPNAPDQRGKHKNHARGSAHPKWNEGRIISSHGYVKVRVGAGHPLADPNGYAYEHILVVLTSNTPGAWLLSQNPGDWVVHHKNGDKTDNQIDNLQVLSRADHNALHNAERERDARGRFIGKSTAGRLLDGQQHNGMPPHHG